MLPQPTQIYDVVPVHPRIEYLETLTSYLTRLCELNGIPSLRGLANIFFSPLQRLTVSQLSDCPLRPFNNLLIATQRSEQELLAATFYHIGAKFQRTKRDSA